MSDPGVKWSSWCHRCLCWFDGKPLCCEICGTRFTMRNRSEFIPTDKPRAELVAELAWEYANHGRPGGPVDTTHLNATWDKLLLALDAWKAERARL